MEKIEKWIEYSVKLKAHINEMLINENNENN